VVEQALHEVGLVEEEGQVADHLGQHRVVHLVGVSGLGLERRRGWDEVYWPQKQWRCAG
jgi:hypothetical protein